MFIHSLLGTDREGAIPVQAKGLSLLIAAYCVSLVFCGLMILLLSRQAARGDSSAQLGMRICSAFLFIFMAGFFFLGHRYTLPLVILMTAAINLVGLCPVCNRRKKALFNGDSSSGKGEQ